MRQQLGTGRVITELGTQLDAGTDRSFLPLCAMQASTDVQLAASPTALQAAVFRNGESAGQRRVGCVQ